MNTIFYVSDKDKNNHYEITFNLSRYNGEVLLRNAGGEGMMMTEEEFFLLIDKHFKENF